MKWCCNYCSSANQDTDEKCKVCDHLQNDEDFLFNPFQEEYELTRKSNLWEEHNKYRYEMDVIKNRGYTKIEKWNNDGEHLYRLVKENGDSKIVTIDILILLGYIVIK